MVPGLELRRIRWMKVLKHANPLLLMHFQAFPGNSNADSVVLHKLQQPVIARYVRIIPDRNPSGRVGLRLETYGCPYGQIGLLFSLSFFFFYFCL